MAKELIKIVEGNPHIKVKCYWYRINREDYEKLKQDKTKLLTLKYPNFKGGKGFREKFYYSDNTILSKVDDKYYLIEHK